MHFGLRLTGGPVSERGGVPGQVHRTKGSTHTCSDWGPRLHLPDMRKESCVRFTSRVHCTSCFKVWESPDGAGTSPCALDGGQEGGEILASAHIFQTLFDVRTPDLEI